MAGNQATARLHAACCESRPVLSRQHDYLALPEIPFAIVRAKIVRRSYDGCDRALRRRRRGDLYLAGSGPHLPSTGCPTRRHTKPPAHGQRKNGLGRFIGYGMLRERQ
ncbi:hypothetical protein Bbelb_230470 [Branchiostoma belcheri]|nr:hypothetical protein Bbelb_230470 [Branchiostoma belcheri]